MARNNDGFPSWATVLKDPPASTEDPLLKWVRKIGVSVAQSWYTEFIRDIAAGAAGAAAANYVVTQNADPKKEAAAKTIAGSVNNAVQDIVKKIADQARGNPNARPTEAQVRQMIEAQARKAAAEREVMRIFGPPGY